MIDVLDFFFNNSTTMVPPEDSSYRLIQSIGAIGTILAFGVVAFQTYLLRGQINILRGQTENLRTQTELLQNEADYNLRPWIYLEPRSDTRPIAVNIETERNTVAATIELRNYGKLATIFRQGIIDIEPIYITDLGRKTFNVNFVEAFLPNKKVTFSWTKNGEDLMKEIFKHEHFFIGFLIEYHYTDRIRDIRMKGKYEVIFLVNVYFTDPDPTGHKRINSTSIGIAHETVE